MAECDSSKQKLPHLFEFVDYTAVVIRRCKENGYAVEEE